MSSVIEMRFQLRVQVEQLRAHRAELRHRRGSGPYLRQQGEITAFDMVLKLIEVLGEDRPLHEEIAEKNPDLHREMCKPPSVFGHLPGVPDTAIEPGDYFR